MFNSVSIFMPCPLNPQRHFRADNAALPSMKSDKLARRAPSHLGNLAGP
jgi:hypothetical protein